MRRCTSPPRVPSTNCEPRRAVLFLTFPARGSKCSEYCVSLHSRPEQLIGCLCLGDRAEDLGKAVRNNLVLALLQLPDSKTEYVWVARRSMTFFEVFIWPGIWISSTHAARSGAHAAYA